jgi:hypothetical protein
MCGQTKRSSSADPAPGTDHHRPAVGQIEE